MKIGEYSTPSNRGLRQLPTRLGGFCSRGFPAMIWAAALGCGFGPMQARAALIPSAGGITVYDTVNNVTWLADFNLAATTRFGLAVCSGSGSKTNACVNPSGSMSYQAATAWVQAMNAASYLGHTNWQLPATPSVDNTGCSFTGPNGNSFGFNCSAGALGSLYYKALGLTPPNAAVSVPDNTVGPFSNFQPYYYWSQTGTSADGHATFSFNTGFQDSNTTPNYMYVLPMIQGKLPGTPSATGQGLQVNPGGQTVYDPMTSVTWLANANISVTNTFGLPRCQDQNTPKPCIGQDGAMNWDSASQFIANMNSGAGYLGQTNWQLPPVDPTCPNYGCGGNLNPMGNLFYNQLGFTQGTPIVSASNVNVGVFHDIQPYIYWSCEASTIQDPCGTAGPATGFEFCFSFDNGFLGTDVLADEYYVTAYYVGPPTSFSAPAITSVQNAATSQTTLAPSTYVAIFGQNLSATNPGRAWTAADFTSNSNGTLNMPTSLDGTSVTFGGAPAYISYISAGQLNVITPPNVTGGNVPVVVKVNGQTSAAFDVTLQSLAPSFFAWDPATSDYGKYLVAQHGGSYTNVGKVGLFPGTPANFTTPASPGETIILYGTGFGPTSPPIPNGIETDKVYQLSPTPAATFGGEAATVVFGGLVPALSQIYQFDVKIPLNAPNGDSPLVVTVNGTQSFSGLITVQR